MNSATRRDTPLLEAFKRLAPHQHACLIFETQAEQLAAVIPFLQIGLERGEKCIYLMEDDRTEAVVEALRAGGIDVNSALQSGAVTLISREGVCTEQASADPDWMIKSLQTTAQAATAAGFPALRTTGEVFCQPGVDPSIQRRIEHESKLNAFFAEHNCLALCQYDRRRVPPEVILDAIRTHPIVVYRGAVCRNHYYVPPDELLEPPQPAREVERLLANVLDREQVQETLCQRRDELEARVQQRTTELEQANLALQVAVAERMRATEALAASEQRYRHIFDNVNDIIFMTDLEGNIASVNKAAERATGYSLAEKRHWHISQIMAPQSLDLARKMVQAKLGGVERTTYELEVNTRDGGTLHFEVSSRLQFREGQPVGVLGIARDVTERRRTETALRESEQRYRTLFETMAQGVVYQDAEGTIISANPAAERILGLSLDQMLGRTSMDPRWKAIHPDGSLFPGETHPSIVALRTGSEVHDAIMGVFDPRREEYRWIRIDAIPQFRPGERGAYQVYTNFQDITEQKQAEDLLRNQKELLQTIFDHISLMVILIDPSGKFKVVNREWQRVLGWSLEEANAGDFWSETYPAPVYRQAVQDFISGSTSQWQDFRTRTRDGRVLDTCWANVRLSDGSIIGIGQDISERKRAEQALRESEAALHRNREELRALTAALLTAQEEERKRVSRELHDGLNQKLAMLAIDVEVLEQRLPLSPDPIQTGLQSLKTRVVELSDDIRRMAYQLHPSILEHLGLTVALRSYCAEFSKREGIKVRFVDRNAPQPLPQDVALCLYRIAQEALRNVARHSGSRRATVALEGKSHAVQLSVTDFGVGFDPQSVKDKGGLGFISMEERVRLVQGSLTVKSSAGHGTRIEVRIPLPEQTARGSEK